MGSRSPWLAELLVRVTLHLLPGKTVRLTCREQNRGNGYRTQPEVTSLSH
jgi:hypothetical protein